MIVGVPAESFPGERRVALVPELVSKLTAAGLEVYVQFGAGVEAGFGDHDYEEKGARLAPDVFAKADVLLKVRPPNADEIQQLREASVFIGLLEPYPSDAQIRLLDARKVTAFAMELMPRIARAADGRSERHEHRCGLQGSPPGGKPAAKIFSPSHDRRRYDHARASFRRWGRSCRFGSDRHCEAARSGRRGVWHAFRS